MKRLTGFAVVALAAAGLALGGLPARAIEAQPQRSPYCSGTYNYASFGQLIVPSNATCILNNSTVTGGANVQPGGSLETCNDSIGGWLTVNHGYVKIDNGTTIGGGVDIVPQGVTALGNNNACQNQTGGNTYSGIFCPNRVGGPATVHDGATSNKPFEIGECGVVHFFSSVTVNNNNLPVSVTDSVIPGNLSCSNNNPPATQGDNQVGGHIVGCATQQTQF